MINIIVAMDKNGLIGNDNKLPWHIPEDLEYFKEKTKHNVVVMGRKTWESLPVKPLPNRLNLILTRNNIDLNYPCTHSTTIDYILNHKITNDFWIIGGAEVYKQFLPYADSLYVTKINHEFEGNIYFPIINWHEWALIESKKGNHSILYYNFMVYRRQ